ncbi:MAG: hypothetical protein ACFFAN_03220 [Promethearchaeota archaeon]
MDKISASNSDKSNLVKKYYKPNFSVMFNRIKDISDSIPIKNDIILALLDGNWHSETDLIRMAKKQHYKYLGVVTLGMMVNSLNHMLKSNYVEKKFINNKVYYKISDNYVGLTRAAYREYRFNI